MVWEENKHPRDKSGQFTSKGNEGQGGSKDFPHKQELDTTVKTLLKEGKNKEQIKNYLKGFNTITYTDEMDSYIDTFFDDDDFDNDFEEEFEEGSREELGKKLADAGYDIDKLKSVDETLEEQPKRTKVAGIKERTENSKKMLTDFINDFVDDDDAQSLEDKLQVVKDEFENYYDAWKRDYPNYQDSFTHFLMDSGLGSSYYDDIYDDLVKIGYVDDPKFKEDTDRLVRVYGFNLYNAFNKMLNGK